jgi:hypothetical protein
MKRHETACNGMEWHGMAWNGMEWHEMAWNGMKWHEMAWNGMEWHGMGYLMAYYGNSDYIPSLICQKFYLSVKRLCQSSQ